MNEGLEQAKPEIKYSKELLRLKIDVQLAVMMLFLGDNIHNQEMADKWITDYSSKFREIFERRILKESDFLNKCESDKEEVVRKIFEELQGV